MPAGGASNAGAPMIRPSQAEQPPLKILMRIGCVIRWSSTVRSSSCNTTWPMIWSGAPQETPEASSTPPHSSKACTGHSGSAAV